jgi:hypothetical protein
VSLIDVVKAVNTNAWEFEKVSSQVYIANVQDVPKQGRFTTLRSA